MVKKGKKMGKRYPTKKYKIETRNRIKFKRRKRRKKRRG